MDRTKKVEELAEIFHSLKRRMIMGSASCVKMPRITPSQWGALMFVEQSNEGTVKDMANVLGVTSSAATQLVDGLVSSGYVVRREDPNDRRRVTLQLSPATRKHVVKMKSRIVKGFLETFKILNDKEFNQYLALNQRLARGLSGKN